MTASEKHKIKLLEFLGNPENDYPERKEYAKMLGISIAALYKHFNPAALQDIENEAYEIRKRNSAKQRATVLKAMFEEAKGGNVQAAKEYLDRTEGKVTDKHEHKIDLSVEEWVEMI